MFVYPLSSAEGRIVRWGGPIVLVGDFLILAVMTLLSFGASGL